MSEFLNPKMDLSRYKRTRYVRFLHFTLKMAAFVSDYDQVDMKMDEVTLEMEILGELEALQIY